MPSTRGVLRHRRDHDAVLQRHAAQRERREHRRDAAAVRRVRAGLRGEPGLEALQLRAVAQAQVLVPDALAARQQRVGELLRLADARSARRSRTIRSNCARRSGCAAPRCCAPPRSAASAAGRSRRMLSPMLRASSIASSSASLVPEPIEKCAVCAASPISTTGSAVACTQVSFRRRAGS